MTIAAQQVHVSENYARKLTENIRRTAVNAKESIDKLNDLIQQAKNGNAHLALGYRSWTAYLSDTLSETPMLLDRDQRQAFVLQLASEGMSQRAIAPIVGVDQKTVSNDLRREENSSPESAFDPTPDLAPRADDWIAADPSTGEIVDAPVTTEHTITEKTKTVVGLDGKTYTPPAPKRREPKPVMTSEQAEQDYLEQLAINFGRALQNMWQLTFPIHREHLISDWPKGKDSATPDAQELATPEMFRAIAVALDQLADEWEKTNG